MDWTSIAAAGSGIVGGFASIGNTNKTIRANKQMAAYQYSKDLEMWNRQNEYNSPEAQQLRLSKAGLNPNLVYGNGTVTGNVSSQMPKYNAPTLEYNYHPEQILQSVGMYQDYKLKQAQIDQVKALTSGQELRNAINGINLALQKEFSRKSFLTDLATRGFRKTQAEASAGVAYNQYLRDTATYDESVTARRNMLEKYSYDLANANIRNSLLGVDKQIKEKISQEKTKELEFLNNGGKYWPLMLQMVKALR